MTKKENVLEKCRINLDKEKVLHSITRGERDKYKERIDKVIEYIKENESVDLYDDVGSAFCRRLLEILKGSDKE